MKNITVTVDDETYRAARVKAAEMDTSVSALVKKYLTELTAGESEFERLKRQEQELRKLVPPGFSAADRLTRDEVHERWRHREG
jgi:plasmid stability protein